MSRLTYCTNVWGGALPKYFLERLYKIQKRAIRIVFNVNYKASTSLLFSKNNIFTLDKLLLFNRGVYMYKILNNLAPNYLYDIFSKCTNVGGKNLRSCSHKNLILPGIKLETGRKAFSYCGANMWNSLPPSIRNVNTLYVFKYKLKNFLLDTCS